MNIVIPCGGVGERFAQEGYAEPKPLVPAMGLPILFWLLDHLNLGPSDAVIIAYNQDLERWRLKDKIASKYGAGRIRVVHLTKPTKGAAETVALALRKLSPVDLSRKTMVLDCDTFYRHDVVSAFRKSPKNMSVVFRDDAPNGPPIYSYCDVDEDLLIRGIKEKERISRWANTGCYCFSDGSSLLAYCDRAIQIASPVKGEYYVSSVISTMLDDGHEWIAHPVSEKDVECLGTPLQLRIFCSSTPTFGRRRICFDLDGTLITHPLTPGDYATVEPHSATIDYLRFLKRLGNTIIIYTARGMRSCGGNLGLVHARSAAAVYDVLDRFHIPYDELYLGKPYADCYIDDLAQNACLDLAKATGFYQTDVDVRKHNQLALSTISTLVKRSTKPLDGEIHWYLNAPSSVRRLVPAFIRHADDFTWYEIERLECTSCSHLFVNECLLPETLLEILQSLDQIHGSADGPQGFALNMYANYCAKLKDRYDSYDYGRFPYGEQTYDMLMAKLAEYEAANGGKMGVIHGDPVLSNVLVLRGSGHKFVDMRGKLGDACSVFGDVFYDFSKVYQSLVGYDEILLGAQVSQGYRQKMATVFEDYVTKTHGPKALQMIRLIAASLFFTLIPLHDNEKCLKYMEKCTELLA